MCVSLVLPVTVVTLGIGMCEGVSRDSGYGHEDIPSMTYDIHVDIFTWMCMGWIDHCMRT